MRVVAASCGLLKVRWLCLGARCPRSRCGGLYRMERGQGEGSLCGVVVRGWACVAWLELCGWRERESCGLRAPGSVS